MRLFKKHLEGKECPQIEWQVNRLSPEIPYERRTNLQVPARVCDAVCSKHSTFGYFDGTARTPSLQSPIPIMAPGE